MIRSSTVMFPVVVSAFLLAMTTKAQAQGVIVLSDQNTRGTILTTQPLMLLYDQPFSLLISLARSDDCITKFGRNATAEISEETGVISVQYEVDEIDAPGCAFGPSDVLSPFSSIKGDFKLELSGLPNRDDQAYRIELIGMHDGQEIFPQPEQVATLLPYHKEGFGEDSVLGETAFNLEEPRVDQTLTGVGVVRGWACQTAPDSVTRVAYQIDDRRLTPMPYGTTRMDAAASCDGNEFVGFGSVINWENLSTGNHEFKLFIDDQLIETRTIQTVLE